MKRILSLILALGLIFPSFSYADWANTADKRWRAPVVNAAALPTVGNIDGDVRYCTATNQLYAFGGAAWNALAGTGIGDTFRISATDTTSGYANTKLTVGTALSKAITSGGADERLYFNVLLDNLSIDVNGSNQLRIKSSGVTAITLNADVAGDGLVLNGVSNALDINVDGTSLDIATDVLRIAPEGVTEDKLDANNGPTSGWFLGWNGSEFEWYDVAATVEASVIWKEITQTMHSFVIGDILRWDSGTSTYVKALADSETNAEVAGIVWQVLDVDTFKLALAGYTHNLVGLTPGTVYFLDAVTPGLLTAVPPAVVGNISKPLLIAISATEGYFYNWRGVEIGAAEAPAGSVSYLTVNDESGTLTDARYLVAGADIQFTDGGAGTTYTIADTSTLTSVTTRGSTTTNAITVGNFQSGAAGADGKVTLYSEQGVTDYSVSLNPNATMTAAVDLYLPAAYPLVNDSVILVSTTGEMTYGQALGTGSTVTFNTVNAVAFDPSGGDNTGHVGQALIRWADIYCVNIHTGDIKMMNDWVIKEDWDGPNGIILVAPNGKKYKFVVEEYND